MSEHLETIKTIKKYINKEDYTGLAEYIEKRELEVSILENKASDYIDELVDELE